MTTVIVETNFYPNNRNAGVKYIQDIDVFFLLRSRCCQERNRSTKDIIGRREDTEDTG